MTHYKDVNNTATTTIESATIQYSPCDRCGGTGSYFSHGPCYRCQGAGLKGSTPFGTGRNWVHYPIKVEGFTVYRNVKTGKVFAISNTTKTVTRITYNGVSPVKPNTLQIASIARKLNKAADGF